jgi:hypothetical protein
MGKKRKPAKDDAASPESFRKPTKPARIRQQLADAVERRIADLAQDFTQYVNDAVRMRLEAEGAWPPKGKSGAEQPKSED